MQTAISAVALTALLGGSGAASAGQPIHESLVECAVLVELMLGEQSFTPGENAIIDLYVTAAESMRAEATQRAGPVYVLRTADTKRAAWQRRWDAGDWDRPGNRSELAEWITYCFKLADHLDLPLEQ